MEYCTELYNYKLDTDTRILESEDDVESRETGESPILKEEVEKAVRMLKDNIPANILKVGGPSIIKDWTKSLIIPPPKKGNTRLCQNYRTISLICHP